MQTSKESSVQLAGTQQPVVNINQLTVGAIITGVAMQFAWRILQIADGDVWMVKLPVTVPPCRTHQFQPYGRGQVCQTCQLRRQKLEDFLPRTENKPRSYIITPAGELYQPEPFTLYGSLVREGTTPSLKTVWLNSESTTPQWNETLPLIPALHVIWTIPSELRALVSETPTVENEDLEIEEDE